MSPAEIAALLRAAEGLEELSVTLDGATLRLRGGGAAPVAAAAPVVAAPAPVPVLRSPAQGVFCAAYPGEAAAGARAVRGGEVVAFLRAGPCLRPVLAEADGWLGEALAGEGALVGYGDALFALGAGR